MTTERENIVIIGGGIQGLSIAAHLVRNEEFRQGDVWVVEMLDGFGRGTTARSAGMFSNTMMDPEKLIPLNRMALQRIHRFEEEFGVNPQFRQCGNLLVAITDEAANRCELQARLQNDRGIETQILTTARIRDLVPDLNTEEVRLGMYCPEDGFVDPALMVQGFKRYALRNGVHLQPNIRATGLVFENNKVVGVKTRRVTETRIDGEEVTIPTNRVINAAGTLAGEVASWSNLNLPLRNEARDLWTIRIGDMTSQMPLVAIEGGPENHSYIRPDFEEGTFIVGVGEMEDFMGEVANPGELILPTSREEMRRFLAAFFPRFHIVDEFGHKGIRSGTVSDIPILGPSSIEGFDLCVGLGGRGIQLALVTGELMTGYIRKGVVSGEMQGFLHIK